MDTDVLVVGAGPVGLTMACELARHGVRVRIVDSAPSPSDTSRAVAIHARTLEMLFQMDLEEEFFAQGVVIRSLQFHTGLVALGQFFFDEVDGPYRCVLDVPQNITERLLSQKLAAFGIVVERPVKLLRFVGGDSGVVADLQHSDGSTEPVHSRWMVGCDGAHSTVRHALGLSFEGAPYPGEFLLADVKIDWELASDQINLFLHANGIVATFPLPGGRYRIVAELGKGPIEKKEFTLDDVRQLFLERVPLHAEFSDAIWISSFRVHHRKVTNYMQGHVFLAGDAAHIHSPAGGQGMNTGMQDAYNLAWKLALVNAGKAEPKLLDSYSEEREPIARSVIALTDRMTKVGTVKSPVLQKLRNLALPLFMGTEFVQHALVNGLAETDLNYRNSSIVDGQGHFVRHAPQPGERAPLPMLSEGRHFGDCLRGTAHHLLLFAASSTEEELSVLSALRRDFEAAYDGLIHVRLISRRVSSVASQALIDENGVIHSRYGIVRPSLCLIRPDGYLAYRSSPPDDAALHRFLRSAYGFVPKPPVRE